MKLMKKSNMLLLIFLFVCWSCQTKTNVDEVDENFETEIDESLKDESDENTESEIDYNIETHVIEACNVENPLTDLPWLKEMIEEITLSCQKSYPIPHPYAVYQCTYGNGQTVFLGEYGVSATIGIFYNCEGECLGLMGGAAGFIFPPHLNIDTVNKKLIWKVNYKKNY